MSQTLTATPPTTRRPRLKRVETATRAHAGRGLILAALGYLVLVPVALVIIVSFRKTDSLVGGAPFGKSATWSLENFTSILSDSGTYELIGNTAVFAIGSLAVAFAIAIAAAWLFERTDFPFRGSLSILMVASLGVPWFVYGIAWTLLLNPSNGVLNVWMRSIFGLSGDGPINIYSMPGMIVVQGISTVPICFLLIASAFRAMNATLEEAAMVAGASRMRTFFRITLPLAAPAILGALVYELGTAIEAFDVPMTIGLRGDVHVLSSQIYLDLRPAQGLPDYGVAGAYGVILVIMVALPLLLYQRVIARAGRYSAITGRSYSSRRLTTSRATKVVGAVFVGGFLLFSLILPALVLLWASLQRFYAAPSWSAVNDMTTAAYTSLLSDGAAREALKNTLILAVTTGLATMILATAVSWIVVRARSRVSKVADSIAFIPHMLPGVVLAFVVLIIYLYVPIPLYATLWIIVVGLITRSISIATRQMNAGIGLIDRELEEAAATCGASPFYSFRRVTLPLLLPSFGSGFALVALLALTNLAFPLALQSQGNLVWASLIWTHWTIGYVPSTAALSLVLMVVAIGLSIVARRLSVRRGGGTTPESVTM